MEDGKGVKKEFKGSQRDYSYIMWTAQKDNKNKVTICPIHKKFVLLQFNYIRINKYKILTTRNG